MRYKKGRLQFAEAFSWYYFFAADGGPFFFKNSIASFAFLAKKGCLLKSFKLPTLSFGRFLLIEILVIMASVLN